MNIRSLLLHFIALSTLVLQPLALQALPEDNQQPINIQADRATQQSLTSGEKTEYYGNVVITQGSLRVTADYVAIHSSNRAVMQIIANGDPAKFQQQSDPAKQPVKAQAKHIDYQLAAETITLTDDAMVKQSDSSFSGNHITYNVADESVVAEERVMMEFMPAAKEDAP